MPDDVARPRQRVLAGEVGDAEVGQLRGAAARAGLVGHDHVLRLDVAVDHAAVVRVGQRVGEREPDPDDVAVGQRGVGLELGQRAPLDELGDEVPAAVLLAGVEERDDALVVEPGDGDGLALGAFRVGAVGGHDLDGDRAPEALVAGGVDGPEATGAEARSEPVAAHRQAGLGDRRQLFRGRHPTSFHAREAPPSRCIRGCTGRNTPPRLISSLHVTRLREERAAYQERSFLSFFDEDDEPRTRVRPRRPASAGGSRRPAVPDHQQVLIRRALLGAGILLVLILLVFIVRGCQNTAKQNALSDYNARRRRARPRLRPGGLRAAVQPAPQPDAGRRPVLADQRLPRPGRPAVRPGEVDLDARRDDPRPAVVPDRDGDAPRRPPVDRRQRAHRALERRRGRRPGDPAASPARCRCSSRPT